MANASLTFPRETTEFLPLDVLDTTTPVTMYSVCVLRYGQRPTTTDWVAAATLGGRYGVTLTGLTPGYYGIWVKVTANPETPVISPDTTGWITVT